MSKSEQRHTAERWLATAREDWDSARILADAGRHAHACFLFQQAAEKAIKALWHAEDSDPWGHSVQRLLQEYPGDIAPPRKNECIEAAAALDKYYIPTRYPNGLPDLTPHTVYRSSDSADAAAKAALILDMATELLSS
jgi:HEPN domain-containing protein